MSLILEALKKSEKERREKTGADAADATPDADGGGASSSPWRIAAGVVAFTVAGLAIGGAIGYFGLVPSPQPPAKPAAKVAAAPKPAPAPAAAPAAVPAAPPPATATKPQQPPTTVAAAPAPVAPAAAAAPKATAPAAIAATPEAAPASPPRPAAAPAADQSQASPQGRLAGVAVPKKKPAAPFAAAMPVTAGEAQTLIRRGRAYEDKGLYAQAIDTYSQAIRLDPDFADAYFGRGWARVANGAYGDAAGDFQRMIALRPDAADAYFGRAWALEQQGDREAAIGLYGEAIRRQPDHADAYFSRGVLEFMAGRMDAAARDFAAVHEWASGRLKDYALLWRYVSVTRGGAAAPTAGFDDWRDDKPWPGILVRLFRGQATPTQVLIAAKDRDATRQRENDCIALFFLGQQRLIAGDAKGAADYFRRTLATGVTYYRQHAAAAAELKRLESGN